MDNYIAIKSNNYNMLVSLSKALSVTFKASTYCEKPCSIEEFKQTKCKGIFVNINLYADLGSGDLPRKHFWWCHGFGNVKVVLNGNCIHDIITVSKITANEKAKRKRKKVTPQNTKSSNT